MGSEIQDIKQGYYIPLKNRLKNNKFDIVKELVEAVRLFLEEKIIPQDEIFILNKTPEILKQLNYKDIGFIISKYVIDKAKFKHHMTNEQILDTLRELNTPLFIFQSDKNKTRTKSSKSSIIITDKIASDTELFGITFYPDEKNKYLETLESRNIVTSIHQRKLIANNNTNVIEEYVNNNLCLYVDVAKLDKIKRSQLYTKFHELIPLHTLFHWASLNCQSYRTLQGLMPTHIYPIGLSKIANHIGSYKGQCLLTPYSIGLSNTQYNTNIIIKKKIIKLKKKDNFMDNRKVINTVVIVTSPSLSVQQRTKEDNTDYYVSTINCKTLDYINVEGEYKPLEFWSRIFYNPVHEESSATGKFFKENIEQIKYEAIKNNSIIYVSGVAEKGGIFIKNPIKIISSFKDIDDKKTNNIVGQILSIHNEPDFLEVISYNFDEKRNIQRTKTYINYTSSITPYLNVLNKSNNLANILGRANFLFSIKKHNDNFYYIHSIQNLDKAFFIERQLIESLEHTVSKTESKETKDSQIQR